MKKHIVTAVLTMAFTMMLSMTAFARGNTTTSEFWMDCGNNQWKICRDAAHTDVITNSWICDDKNNGNQNDNWYLIKNDGFMYDGIIHDENGNYYLLDPNHNGTFGMMISENGFSYNGVSFQFNQNHDGTYGKILNTEAVAASGLKVTEVNLGGKPNLYTSQFTSGTQQNQGGSSVQNNAAGGAKNLNDYAGTYHCGAVYQNGEQYRSTTNITIKATSADTGTITFNNCELYSDFTVELAKNDDIHGWSGGGFTDDNLITVMVMAKNFTDTNELYMDVRTIGFIGFEVYEWVFVQ